MVIYNSNNDTVLFIRVKAKVNDQCIIIYGEKKFINLLSYLVIIKKKKNDESSNLTVPWLYLLHKFIYIQIHKVMG